MKRTMLILAMLVLPLSANAGEKVKGTNFFVVEEQNFATGEETGYWLWHGKGVTRKVEGPVESHAIDCHGAGFWDSDGAWGEGICVHTVGDDTFMDHWKNLKGQEGGEFKWMNGTGKFAGISGGGTFKTQQQLSGRLIVDWEGEMTLK